MSDFLKVYMAIGEGGPEGKDGPWFCGNLNYLDKKLIPWLRERGATEVFVAEVLMPPDAYTRLGGSQEMPRGTTKETE